MSGQNDTALGLSRLLLWLLIALNLFAGVMVAVGFVGSFDFEETISEYCRENDLNESILIPTLRVWVFLAVPVIAAVHIQLTKLKEIVETVRQGDPFVAENADRLRVIAWALLVTQVMHLVFGAMVHIARSANAEMEWEFSLTGWLAVLLLFVLARVFKEGARLRDDLEAMI